MADESAFEELFRLEFPRLVRALAVAEGVDEAADAVQEAFIEADRRWPRVSQLDDPAGWIRRVAINRLLTRRRTRLRRLRITAQIVAVEVTQLAERDVELLDALKLLPAQQRRSLCLHHIAGYSVTEIAAMLGVSPGTVKSNLHDARANLQARREVQ